MASSQHRVPPPPCPVCQQTDQVKRLPAAYESGIERFAPPPMPVARVGMMRYIVVAFALVLVGAFIILTFAGVGGYAAWPQPVQVALAVVVLAAIVTALLLSIIAIQRVGRADLQSQKYLPAWDEAMEHWRSLYYCKRDDVVFDPQTNKTLSDAAVKSLLTVEKAVPAQQTQTRSAAASHQ